MHENTLPLLAFILTAGIACQWLGWRLKLPSILFLLPCGIIFGPVLGWLSADSLFGDLLFPFVSLAVAVILFEGSLGLRFSDIPGLGKVIRNLISQGVLISWVVTTAATRFFLGFSWELAFLFGAIMVVTGPTVIMPLIRTVRPKESIANVLQWEGILIDPIGAILAVLTYEFIISGGIQGGMTAGALVFGKTLLFGSLLGIGAGYLLYLLISKYWIPHFLQNVVTLAFVCGIYTLSDLLQPESGLLAVTIMGVWLANEKDLVLEDLLDFKESLSLLLISCLFIVLASRLNLADFLDLGWPALGVLAVIQFLVRPLSVHICTFRSKLSMRERHLLAWIAPRGIVAAAISALFAIKLEAHGYDSAGQIVPLAFLVIIGTVLLQSMTARRIAKGLQVSEPDPRGFLVIGANPVARFLARALQENDFRVILADPNWTAVSEATLQGFMAYWGNPVSEHAERHLNLVGIGHLLAISPHTELNLLATHYYRQEFEPNRIFAIRNHLHAADHGEKSEFKYGGQLLFDESLTYQALEQFIAGGAEIKKTQLTEEFSYTDYLAENRDRRLPLFAIDSAQQLHIFSPESEFALQSGWQVIALEKGGS